jgi:hypothetical protein
MSAESLILALVLLEDSEFFEALAGHAGLFELAFALAVLPVLVEDQEEVLRDEPRWVECFLFKVPNVKCLSVVGILLLAIILTLQE